ncbi:hypothetical protein E4U38_001962 [Claviceps purpurea]|nr:hypothetical protein E4U38_001962 [Claviceps purpurea]
MLVERDALLGVKGSLTKMEGKYHPIKLEEMRGFKEELQKIFDETCALFSPRAPRVRFRRPPMCATDFLWFQFKEYLDISRQEDAIFVLDHIEIPLKKILEELKAVDENCVFLERDVQILFELEPQEISCTHAWSFSGTATLVASDEVREAMEFLAPHFDQTIDKSQKARRKVQKIFIQLYHYLTALLPSLVRLPERQKDECQVLADSSIERLAFNGAAGQWYLAFTLLALRQSDQTGQESRQIIVETLPKWAGGSSNAPPPPNASPSSGASSSGAPAGASSSGAPAGSAPSEGGTGASGSSASRAEESDTQRQSAQTDIVTLLAYGYTFVSKGAVSANIRHLQHEADIYKQLEPIQGVHVPVFLGAIDLREMNKFYWIYPEIRVVYFMFLSWGGYCIDRYEMAQFEISLERLEEQAEKTMVSVHDKGVIHQDVRWENILFNPETNGIMMIDFERADLQKTHETRKSNKRTLDQMRHAEMREIAFAVSQELPTPRHVF